MAEGERTRPERQQSQAALEADQEMIQMLEDHQEEEELHQVLDQIETQVPDQRLKAVRPGLGLDPEWNN